MTKSEKPVGIKEIADALGVSVRTIRRYHLKGSIKTFQLGGPYTQIKMRKVDLRKLVGSKE